MTRPLESIRRLPAVGVLAERQMGGFLAMSALVGIGAGFGAAVLVLLLAGMKNLLAPLGISEGHFWIFATVPLGFVVAWWIAQRFAPEVAGDGVPESTAALAVHGGRMRKRAAPMKLLATLATLGTGGSGGREGPIVQIGAAIGSVMSRWFHLGEDQVRSLVAAGAGAGIGASFNAPIAGMLFAMEVILSSFATRQMSAVVIASVAAAVTARSITRPFIGEELAIRAGSYSLGDVRELLLYTALAIVVVIVGFFFLRFLERLETLKMEWEHRLGVLRPLGAGVLVAGLIFIEPRIFGTGQDVTNSLLLNEQVSAVTGTAAELWWVLILLALGKAVATSLTISSGGSGGAFMPSLFMGAAVGAGFARLVQPIWPVDDLQIGAYAVVGMAAMFAVVGRAPLTAILIVFEVTGAHDYNLILPLMLTASLGTFLAERFTSESVYTMALKHMGIKIRRTGDVDLLDTINVGSVMTGPTMVAAPDEVVSQVETRLNASRSHGVPVVDDERLVGIITVSDITRAGTTDGTRVSEAMTARPATVVPSTPVSRALERMAALGVGRLPVVDEENPERLVGLFRREDAVRAYHEALTASTDSELHRKRLAQRTDPGAGYYDFRVPPGSVADGRAIREVTWPEGSTLVSIRRGRLVLVPSGNTVLNAGDVITAFGTETSKGLMIERLNAGAEEPTAEIMLGEDGHESGQPDRGT